MPDLPYDVLFQFVCPLVVPVVGVLVSWTVGGYLQRRHLAHIAERREALAGVVVTNLRLPVGASPTLVVGDAVISAGYLRGLLAKVKKIFGGELRSYRTIMFRAREEAQLRMLAAAQASGCDAVANVRIDTVDLATTTNKSNSPATYVAILASGTAYRTGSAGG